MAKTLQDNTRVTRFWILQQDKSTSLEGWKIALIAISIFSVFALCVGIAFKHSRRKTLYINNTAESHTLQQESINHETSSPEAALRLSSQNSLQLNPSEEYAPFILFSKLNKVFLGCFDPII